MYTLQEIIFIYGAENRCARRTARVFNEKHPDKNTSHQYVIDLERKFEKTDSVCNKINKKPKILDEASHTQIEVLGNLAMDPITSISKVARLTNISAGSTHQVLKQNKFFPYKVRILQQLEDNFDRRIQFCELMSQRIQDDPNMTQNICFSDESTFFLNGFVNKQL